MFFNFLQRKIKTKNFDNIYRICTWSVSEVYWQNWIQSPQIHMCKAFGKYFQDFPHYCCIILFGPYNLYAEY